MRPRRHSSSAAGASNVARRSSVSSRDIQLVQQQLAFKRQYQRLFASQHIIVVILVGAPLIIFLFNHCLMKLDGSIRKLLLEMRDPFTMITSTIWPTLCDRIAWQIIGILIVIQLILANIVPGEDVVGAATSSGSRGIYRSNSLSCMILTVLLYLLAVLFGVYPGAIIFNHWHRILANLNIIGILLTIVLYAKAHLLPTYDTDVCNGNSSPILDIFQGVELIPRLGWIDIKHFVTCRLIMNLWPLFIISAVFRQKDTYGRISDGLSACALLQLVYILKWHWCECVYVTGMDMQHTRAGFYRIWGVLVCVPSLYFSPIAYIATHPFGIHRLYCLACVIIGLVCIYLTYDIDMQRVEFRRANGNIKIWNRDPYFITAKYRNDHGETMANLLLGSGWWGWSRHAHYTTEFGTFICWTLLTNTRQWLPYFPLIFLLLLLIDRMYRDEMRCLAKYGQCWLQYCNRVPYLLLPGFI